MKEMYDEEAHHKIVSLIERTSTNGLKKRLRVNELIRVRHMGKTGEIGFKDVTESPMTGESVKSMIKKELKERGDIMTEFTKVGNHTSTFKIIDEGQVFHFTSPHPNPDDLFIKSDQKRCEAISLKNGNHRVVGQCTEVRKVKLIEVKYEER